MLRDGLVPEHFFGNYTKVSEKNSDNYIVKSYKGMEGGVYMRIEAYTQVQQIYNTNKTAKTQSAGKASFKDQLQISSVGKDIQTAKAAVAGSSDIREDMIAPLKEKIQNGTYEVSADSFADKLFAKYEEMR